jgi:hypothetical protein
MDLTTIEPQTETKQLIHAEDQQIQTIRGEAEMRAQLLNEILRHGIVKNSELKQVAMSEQSIKNFIFNEQLKTNKTMALQYQAGKRMQLGEYALPSNLEHLMDDLMSWLTYPMQRRGTDKFQFLFYTDRWAVNEPELSSFFVKSKYEIFINSDVIKEVSRLQDFCDYLEKEGAEPHQLLSIAFFNHRLTCDDRLACNKLPKRKFMVKLSWLLREK